MDLRAKIAARAEHLLRHHPAADPAPTPVASPPPAGVGVSLIPAYHGLACWLCSGHMQPCCRPDCPKAWKLKDAPKFPREGEWKKEGRK